MRRSAKSYRSRIENAATLVVLVAGCHQLKATIIEFADHSTKHPFWHEP